MAARPTMEVEIRQINEKLALMSSIIEAAILNAIKSFSERDSVLARKIIDGDEVIDDIEDEINALCLRFLATQQPVAGDLRYAISIMKVIRDLERIGDHCEDIAKATLRFEDKPFIKELIDIPRMADMSSRMVKNAIDSFMHHDLRLARRVWKADDEVDEIYSYLYDELVNLAETDPSKTAQCIKFLLIAAHLERISDYATNICEETVFVMEGSYDME
jgi:phosphate transport system protein